MPEIDSWNAYHEAVWPEQVGDPHSPVTLSLRHPSYPFEADLESDDPQALRGIVAMYLSKVRERLGLPELFSSGSDFKVHMAWLQLPDGDSSLDPRESFRVTRYKDPVDKEGTIDRSVVFVAGESWLANDSATLLGSRLGLRVVAHLHKRGSESCKVRVTSVACSAGLPQAFGLRTTSNETIAFYNFVFAPTNLLPMKALIRQFARLDADTPVAIDGVRAMTVKGQAMGTIYAIAWQKRKGYLRPSPHERPAYDRPPGGHPPDEHPPGGHPSDEHQGTSYALTLRFPIATNDWINPTSTNTPAVNRDPLVAHAAPPVRANLFTRDPASKAGLGKLIESRPNRSPKRLNAFKDTNVLLEGISLNGVNCTLLDDLNLVNVRQSRLVKGDTDEGLPKEVCPADVVQPRMDNFAALGGYERTRANFSQYHHRPLFETLIAYGLSPYAYFRFAINPLQIRYRSPITPGPGKDGKTVNAQVDFDPPHRDLIANAEPWTPAALRPLRVRFALADLKRSTSRRQPLGLAADPRWSWHEYCHVLLAAQTGRLELHFAHSAGDALAAIVSDPWSELVKYPWPRGYTFPWVYLHRRHDRAVDRGWGWSGRRHRPNRLPALDSNSQHKGYDSEQILSTSLFRLYRALGGDTVDGATGEPDRRAREDAADYTVYLILRAIKLMPAYNVSVVETVDQFVTTLIDADIATWPASSGPLKDRVGGWAHKVVRWAFEAQGLYATTNPLEVINRPGLPPPVDIFIDSGRPDSEGPYTRGGYMPVSLDWKGAGPKPWHAAADALKIVAGQIQVDVRNRGSTVANDVTVSVWYIVRPDGAANPPNWNPTTWTKIGDRGPAAVPPWPAPAVSFGPFAPPPAQPATKRVWILAIADCAADRANTNPLTSLPCSISAVSIVDLVAGDNNLGLWVVS
jgi:hypothetical protein